MTREESIENLIERAVICGEQEPCEHAINLETVIEWLKAKDIIKLFSQEETARKELKALLPVNPQEPSGYAISQQAALDAFGLSEKSRKYGGDHSGYDTMMKYEIQDILESLPPVTPQPKTGHWIRWYEQKEKDCVIENIPHCKCSECGKEYDPHSSQFIKYCNECGAKMQEVEK